MFKIVGNDIYLSKGDTATIAIKIRDTNNRSFQLGGTDSLTLTVKKHTNDTSPRIVKQGSDFEQFTDTVAGQDIYRYVCKITTADTANIQECGEYVYDVRLDYSTSGNTGGRCTLIKPSKFVIEDVVSDPSVSAASQSNSSSGGGGE